jgi:glycosyltransferase involved in cell wall biosynthesis
MNPDPGAIHVARDLPNLAAAEVPSDAALSPPGDGTDLRIVFLSRIAREKNLDFALKVLGRVSCNVTLDIYGPVDNEAHWNDCLALMRDLPPNVTACYRGSHSQPSRILGLYDLLLLPTGGENYGHVIAEALTAGTPVLISDKTPWRNLREDGLGWDIPLDDADSFRRVIEECACATGAERARSKHHIRSTITKRLFDPAAVEANTRLFTDQVPRRTTATHPRSLPGFS